MCNIRLLILLVLLSYSSTVYANIVCVEPDKGFRNNAAGRGWFWGQQVCEPKDNETEQVTQNEPKEDNKTEWKILPKTANIPWDILDQLDPDEIANKIEPEAKKVAIVYPTDENIMAYRKLSRWMVSKAKAYTARDVQVKTENPMLVPEALIAPTSEYKTREVIFQQNRAKEKILADYKESAKIVVYSRSGCSFCSAQRPILEAFASEYGWEIIERDINKNYTEAVRFNVEVTPDMFLLYNSPNGIQYQRIATGLTSLPDLVLAVINGFKYLGEDVDYEKVYDN